MQTKPFSLIVTSALLASAMALTACQKKEEPRTPGQQVDAAIAKTEQAAAEAKKDIKDAAHDAKVATENAADKAKVALDDAGITAAVNAEYVKDTELSALKINVDTKAGMVTLRGVAPNKMARERAETLARSISGVVGVDNQLSIKL